MYTSFNGDFRRRPEQNLSGASSKLTRFEIIHRAQQERVKREEQRNHLRSAVRIQSHVRSFLVRQHFKRAEKKRFETIQDKFQPGSYLDGPIRSLLFFYVPSEDFDKLVWLCQNILKQKKDILLALPHDSYWRFRIKRLLELCVDSLQPLRNNAIILRILDVFLSDGLCEDPTTKSIVTTFFSSLATRGFFEKMRKYLDESTKIESNPMLFVEICNYVIRPIKIIKDSDNKEINAVENQYIKLIFSQVCTHLLGRPFAEPFKDVFLSQLIQTSFPHQQFYKFLVDNPEGVDFSVSLFYCVLKLVPDISKTCMETNRYYLRAMALLSENIRRASKFEKMTYTDSMLAKNNDDEDDEMEVGDYVGDGLDGLLSNCIDICNGEVFVNNLLIWLKENDSISDQAMNSLAMICFNMLTREENAVQKYKLLYMLAFNPTFLRAMWSAPTNKTLLDGLQRGAHVLDTWSVQPTCRLSTFCELFNLLLTTLHDDEFWSTNLAGERESVCSMPFTATEIVDMCKFLKQLVDGLIELTVSTPRLNSCISLQTTISNNESFIKFWLMLYKSAVKLIMNLYQKDSRIQFCTDNLWTKQNIFSFPTDYHRIEQVARVFAEIEIDDKPPLTTCETRWMQVLQDLPFLLPFTSRVLLFRALVQRLHRQHQDPDRTPFLLGPSVNISIRRSHIYEDAYLKLQDADLRQKLRIQFVNAVGLEEAGIDGGGILREFLSELLTTCFDPNRGYFKLNRSNLLYPNPNVHRVDVDFSKHYYFIGKMLGKTLYENIQVELPLAEFFLTKLVAKKFDVDFHYLASLDQVMYKSMLFLKNYSDNFQDLGLDFTIVNEELGETRVDELKPNGSNIAVTSTNRIEYIHLLADYKMNKQIRQQCLAFKQGLHSVIDLSYLQIFSNRELQLIISGADYEVDISDLKAHTNYSGDRTADHPVIQSFWKIVENFTSTQKRQLLKFVTSCSRPPLLGFKELQPAFSIQLADGADRLPTASTCMNLLKIPAIPDPDVLKDRLIYAISQGAGFELS